MSSTHSFLYFLRLQTFHQPLAEMESQAFFGVEIEEDQRFIISKEKIDISHAAFIQWGGRILAEAASLEELCTKVREQQIIFERARVLHPSAGLHPKVIQEDLFTLLEEVTGTFDLSNPQELYALTRDHDKWYFVSIHSSCSKKWFRHKKKPATFSSALNSITARTIINCLQSAGPSFLDCGCGSGSVTLEACDSGLEVTAIDRHQQAIDMTRENLLHFNFKARLELSSLDKWKETHDSAVIDFPYGHFCKRDEQEESEMLQQLYPLVKEVVFIASTDLSAQMQQIGYQILKQKVMKYPNVTRHIIHARAGRV